MKRARDWGEDTYDPVMPAKRADHGNDEMKSKLVTPTLMSFKQFLATQVGAQWKTVDE